MKQMEWKKKKARGRLSLVAGALLLLAGQPLQAQAPAKPAKKTDLKQEQKTAEPGTAAAPKKENTDAQKLDTVVVKEAAVTTSEVAEYELDRVPGGTNLIRIEDLSKGTVGTVADVLKFQPGIYAESLNGGEATRLSIRGSGIIRGGFLFGWGNVLQLDGQRLYGASGNPYESIEPLAISHVEVLRGANAFEDGPLSLGGSINYVTKTGYDASPYEARFEAGSFGYFHEQVSSGQVVGPADYYISLSRFDKDGYRNYTTSNSSRVVGNFGYQFNPDIKTRFFFRFAQQYQEDAGLLTWNRLQTNPKQAQFEGLPGTQYSNRINPGSYVVGNTTTLQIDPTSNLEVGWQYDNSPIDTTIGRNTQTFFEFQQVAGSIRYKREDELFDRQSNSQIAFLSHYSLPTYWKSVIAPGNAFAGQVAAMRPSQQSDWTLLATNDTEVVDKLWLNTGIAGIFQHRETSVTQGIDALGNPNPLVGQTYSDDYWNFAPKLGLRYEFTPTNQIYANVSRSIDTPSSNSYVRTDAFFRPVSFVPLKEATATTVEVGTRGAESIFSWNASYYHSWVNNELLTVQIPGGAPGATQSSNATPTIHQGIEVGFDTQLWKDLKVDGDPASPQQQIVLRQNYTWNNFTYAGDPVFHQNELAGVPVHLYQAELAYEHDSGFYAGLNVNASITKYAGDFANSIYNPSYGIFGAKIGYRQPDKGFEVFLEFRNILDEQYASVVSPVFNAGGLDSAIYSPGEGRAINGGISYSF